MKERHSGEKGIVRQMDLGRRQQLDSTYQLWDYENTHGRRDATRTPDLKYNPKKAMKEAERAYMAARGMTKKGFFERIKEFCGSLFLKKGKR